MARFLVDPEDSGGGGDTEHPGTGTQSVEIGEGADAATGWSVAIGVDSLASGTGDNIAIGDFARATGPEGLAIGGGSLASGDQSEAIGVSADATGDQTVAFGTASGAWGDQATALGNSASASATNGTAVGGGSTAGFTFSSGSADSISDATALGNGAWAKHDRSIAIGPATTTEDDQCVIYASNLELVPSGGGTTETALTLMDDLGTTYRVYVDNTGVLHPSSGGGAAFTPEVCAYQEWNTFAGSGFASGTIVAKPTVRMTANVPAVPASPAISFNTGTGYFNFATTGVYSCFAYASVKGMAAKVNTSASPRVNMEMGGDNTLFNSPGIWPRIEVTPALGFTGVETNLYVPATYFPSGSRIKFSVGVSAAGTTTWYIEGYYLIVTRVG